MQRSKRIHGFDDQPVGGHVSQSFQPKAVGGPYKPPLLDPLDGFRQYNPPARCRDCGGKFRDLHVMLRTCIGCTPDLDEPEEEDEEAAADA